MKRFTVKELREVIDGVSDDTVVIISSGEHGYRFAYAEVSTALEENRAYGLFTEDHGETYTPEAEFGTRVPAVIVG